MKAKRRRSTHTLRSHRAAGGRSKKGGGKDQGLAELHLQLSGARSDAPDLPWAPRVSAQGSRAETIA